MQILFIYDNGQSSRIHNLLQGQFLQCGWLAITSLCFYSNKPAITADYKVWYSGPAKHTANGHKIPDLTLIRSKQLLDRLLNSSFRCHLYLVPIAKCNRIYHIQM